MSVPEPGRSRKAGNNRQRDRVGGGAGRGSSKPTKKKSSKKAKKATKKGFEEKSRELVHFVTRLSKVLITSPEAEEDGIFEKVSKDDIIIFYREFYLPFPPQIGMKIRHGEFEEEILDVTWDAREG